MNATSIPENQPVPVVYTHSVKIEDTAKGIRLSAHVYTNDKQTAINEAITTYLETKLKAESEKQNGEEEKRTFSEKQEKELKDEEELREEERRIKDEIKRLEEKKQLEKDKGEIE